MRWSKEELREIGPLGLPDHIDAERLDYRSDNLTAGGEAAVTREIAHRYNVFQRMFEALQVSKACLAGVGSGVRGEGFKVVAEALKDASEGIDG